MARCNKPGNGYDHCDPDSEGWFTINPAIGTYSIIEATNLLPGETVTVMKNVDGVWEEFAEINDGSRPLIAPGGTSYLIDARAVPTDNDPCVGFSVLTRRGPPPEENIDYEIEALDGYVDSQNGSPVVVMLVNDETTYFSADPNGGLIEIPENRVVPETDNTSVVEKVELCAVGDSRVETIDSLIALASSPETKQNVRWLKVTVLETFTPTTDGGRHAGKGSVELSWPSGETTLLHNCDSTQMLIDAGPRADLPTTIAQDGTIILDENVCIEVELVTE